MGWIWEYLDAAGDSRDRSEVFESRNDAESFIGEAFAGLLEQGIQQVRLLEGNRERYTMSLLPE